MDNECQVQSTQTSVISQAPAIVESSRRGFLRQAVVAGIAASALMSLGKKAEANAPPVEDIRATYDADGNLYTFKIEINGQTGNAFSGVIHEGSVDTPISGTVTGQRSTGNSEPITVVFDRTLPDGTVQTYTGALATSYGSNVVKFMAGVFYHNGLGPYPWSAQAIYPG